MSTLTRDGTAEPISQDKILRRERGQGKRHFPCSADHEQDWQPYTVDPYSAVSDDHTYIHTYYSVGDRRARKSAICPFSLFRNRATPELSRLLHSLLIILMFS